MTTYHAAEADELENLLYRIELKDQCALRELYNKVAKRLSNAANQLLHDVDLSEDVVQETLLQVWNKAGEYQREQSEPMTWLNAILRYRALDKLKHEKLIQKRLSYFEHMQDLNEESSTETPLGIMLREELNQRLNSCLRSLRMMNRNALFMAYCYDYSRESIALHLNQPVNSIKTWLRRDLGKLNLVLTK